MKNNSKRTPLQLARIFHRDFIKNGVNRNPRIAGEAWFDADATVEYILHLPQSLCAESRMSNHLRELMEDGDLENILELETVDEERLLGIYGFIIIGRVGAWDFSRTVFDENGHIDSCGGAGSSYVIQVFGITLKEAYRKFIAQTVTRTAKTIEAAAKVAVT